PYSLGNTVSNTGEDLALYFFRLREAKEGIAQNVMRKGLIFMGVLSSYGEIIKGDLIKHLTREALNYFAEALTIE
mgnify:CR=1